MRYEITEVGKVSILGISFDDEGVDLTEHTTIVGNRQAAMDYLSHFVKDCHQNYAHLFPRPEHHGPIEHEEGGLI